MGRWGVSIVCLLTACSKNSGPTADFGKDGRKIVAPDGWEVADPFTRKTPYHVTSSYCLVPSPSKEFHMAMLRKNDSTSQAFVFYGLRYSVAPVYEKCFDYKEKSMTARARNDEAFETADGVTVNMKVITEGGGLIDKRSFLLTLGRAEHGDKMFVINAGGRGGDFTMDDARDVVAGITLGPE